MRRGRRLLGSVRVPGGPACGWARRSRRSRGAGAARCRAVWARTIGSVRDPSLRAAGRLRGGLLCGVGRGSRPRRTPLLAGLWSSSPRLFYAICGAGVKHAVSAWRRLSAAPSAGGAALRWAGRDIREAGGKSWGGEALRCCWSSGTRWEERGELEGKAGCCGASAWGCVSTARAVFWGMGAVLRTTALMEARFVQGGKNERW